ncbi:MAG TPA: NF038122 family metalloprotease [Micropepsaceae bacterium]|nr:NF038122 family metalloprotease [Micropepsaceae bacterium]
MSLLSAFLSAVKSEINWVISSLALAETAADAQPAEAPAGDGKPSHDADATPTDAKLEVASIVKTQDDSAPHHHAPLSLNAEQNYLHHIAYHSDDSDAANAKSALLASGAGALVLPHASVTADSVAIENISSPQSALSEDFGSHAQPLDNSGDSVFQFAGATGHAHGGPGGGGGGSSTPTYTAVVGTGSGLHPTIDLIWDSSVANAPGGFNSNGAFTKAVTDAAQYLANTLHDNITINITIGFGEVAGHRLPSSALGESITNLNSSSYLAIANALSSTAEKAGDAYPITDPNPSPLSDPTSSGNFWVTTAEAKALGFTPVPQETISAIPSGGSVAVPLNVDGHVGFSSFKGIFNYSTEGGKTGDTIVGYDFYATVLHEITEVMGRMVFAGGNVNGSTNSYEPLDLFRFLNGSADVSSTKGGYFSIDGGATDVHNFNGGSGDYADWDNSQIEDSFNAAGTPNVIETTGGVLPDFDLKTLDAIGWNLA